MIEALPVIILTILTFLGECAVAQNLSWVAPTNYLPQGYVVFHGTQSGAYSDCWGTGANTNFSLPDNSLSAGANYFVVTSFISDGTNLLMSSWSNEAVVTNTPSLLLTTIILASTNLSGGSWLPLETNRMVIHPSNPVQFMTASNSLMETNVLTFPR